MLIMYKRQTKPIELTTLITLHYNTLIVSMRSKT